MLDMLKKLWSAVKSVLEPISKIMSSVVNFVLLAIVYFISIGIVSIVSKLFGRHFLALKKQNRKTNWDENKLAKQPLEQYYRTF